MNTKQLGAIAFSLLLSGVNGLWAQDRENSKENQDFDEVIIRKKSDKDSKLTIEIKGNKVTVNGKPVEDFENENVAVILRRIPRLNMPPANSRFKNFEEKELENEGEQGWSQAQPNKALLGVTTEPDEKGAKVMEVSKSSPAEKAGLEKGDVITRVNEATVSSPAELSRIIGTYEPDDEITVTYIRDEKTKKVTVKLAKRPATFNRAYGLQIPEMPTPPLSPEELEKGFPGAREFNFRFKNKDGELFLTPEQKPRIGIKAQDTEDGKGVAVLEITPGSAADKAGLKEGDIITRFDGRSVNNTDELTEAAEGSKDKPVVTAELRRNGKIQMVEIKTPKKLKTANL